MGVMGGRETLGAIPRINHIISNTNPFWRYVDGRIRWQTLSPRSDLMGGSDEENFVSWVLDVRESFRGSAERQHCHS